ncbi:MAG: sulfate adenylyltransferase subunit 2 [Deltaproteobacteria bacterium]|nr:sulfate adenylyltransferase subunit 2 [Deltaproteobacteria bacterium]
MSLSPSQTSELHERLEAEYLDALENQTIFIFREAYRRFENLAMLWSIGKDSTAMLWVARKAFFGRVPFPLVHIDTSLKHPVMLTFRDKIAREWKLELLVGQNKEALAGGMGPSKGRFECCTALKTNALQQMIDAHGFKGIFLGIRRDEEGSRAKERVFSPRDRDFQWNFKDQPPELWDQFNTAYGDDTHVRIHPILHWTEMDIWRYIRRERIPVCPLYFSDGTRRYRSLGCVPCNSPFPSTAGTVDEILAELERTSTPERAGRAQDHEKAYMMQKLRSLGYM